MREQSYSGFCRVFFSILAVVIVGGTLLTHTASVSSQRRSRSVPESPQATFAWNVEGTNNWNVAANWNPSSGFPNAPADVANFSSSGNQNNRTTVIPDGVNITVGAMNFSDDDTNIIRPGNGSGTGTLTLDATAPPAVITAIASVFPVTIETGVILSDPLTITNNAGPGGSAVSFTGAISGAQGLTKEGTGDVVLEFGGAGTYTGATTINAGNLVVNKSVATSTFNLPGGTLSGQGTTGPINATGGRLNPDATLTMTAAGNVSLNAATTLASR